MNENDQPDAPKYKVLVNTEEQYSLWQNHLKVPRGWRECKRGTKEECLAYIEQVWTDMRPLSLRRAMQQAQAAKP